MAPGRDDWEDYRRRMLEETSRFIEWGLAHPEQVSWIPCRPADRGGFPPAVANWFWAVVLSDGRSRLAHWRSRLATLVRRS